MTAQYSPYLLPYAFSMVISIGVGIYVWQRREANGVIWYAAYAAMQVVYTFGYIFELASPDLDSKIFWDNFQWFGSMMIGPSMLLFALQYTGRKFRFFRQMAIIAVAAAGIITVLAYTNDFHHLIRTQAELLPAEPFNVLYYKFTALDWVLTVYIAGTAYISVGIMVQRFWRAIGIYRRQLITIVAGFIIPITIDLLGLFGITFNGQRDTSPLMFGISNLIIVWGLFGYRLFNIMPIARDTIFENVQSSIIVADKAGRIVDFNPAARSIIEDTTSGTIGQPLAYVVPEWLAYRDDFSRLGKGSFNIQRSSSGTDIHYEVIHSQLFDHQKRNVGCVLILRDVTERFQSQAMLQQRTEALEKANAELEIAWRAAQDADKVKAQFLAHMSHELRTPLNAILNFTDFLKSGWLGPTTDKQVDALQKIGESSNHLLSLINDVLDITRIGAGMMRLRTEEIDDMLEFLAPVIATAQAMLSGKPVSFLTDIDPSFPPFVVDKRRITQVLLNLLSNATKFTEKGSVTFSVKNRGSEVLFAVSDTGPGIAPEDQTAIFEPFRQSDYGIEKGGGTGLGLPISAGLIAAHHGRLWLESEVGQGANFYATVPLKPPAQP